MLIIPKHIYLKIHNEWENVIKNIIQNVIQNIIQNVIQNVIKIAIFSKIVINFKSNYSIKNVIRLHYLIT